MKFLNSLINYVIYSVNDVNEVNNCGAIVIPMQMLRSLSPEGVMLRIAISYPFLNPGSFIIVDSQRMFTFLSRKEVSHFVKSSFKILVL